MDVLTVEQRRLNMSRIRGRDTKPELVLRRALHASGLRFRVHVRELPGCPDLVFPKHRVAAFVNGCFWHGHDCDLFRMPATRRDFWQKKISGNRNRDIKRLAALKEQGWRTLTVWECALKGPKRSSVEKISGRCKSFIKSKNRNYLEISGVNELRG